jgi:hypothetical protein
VAVGHDRDVLEDERHVRRVEDLLLRFALDGLPGKKDDGTLAYALHLLVRIHASSGRR